MAEEGLMMWLFPDFVLDQDLNGGLRVPHLVEEFRS